MVPLAHWCAAVTVHAAIRGWQGRGPRVSPSRVAKLLATPSLRRGRRTDAGRRKIVGVTVSDSICQDSDQASNCFRVLAQAGRLNRPNRRRMGGAFLAYANTASSAEVQPSLSWREHSDTAHCLHQTNGVKRTDLTDSTEASLIADPGPERCDPGVETRVRSRSLGTGGRAVAGQRPRATPPSLPGSSLLMWPGADAVLIITPSCWPDDDWARN